MNVLTSQMPLSRELRGVTGNPFTGMGSEVMRSVGSAAQYICREFSEKFGDRLEWRTAAVALETAAANPRMIPHATDAVEALLATERKLLDY